MNVTLTMPFPRRLSQPTAQRLLEANGWVRTVGGQHVVTMVKSGRRPMTLPIHGGQPYGANLTRAILDTAGLRPCPAERD